MVVAEQIAKSVNELDRLFSRSVQSEPPYLLDGEERGVDRDIELADRYLRSGRFCGHDQQNDRWILKEVSR